jgi:hypothetical protein
LLLLSLARLLLAHAFWGDGWLKFYVTMIIKRGRVKDASWIGSYLKFVVSQQKRHCFCAGKREGVITPPMILEKMELAP